MAVLSSFCGLLTLQVGAAVLAVIFFTLAAVILAANIFDYSSPTDDWPLNLILMIFFVLGLISIGLSMFVSSYSENRRCAIIAVIGLVVLVCYWIILCCFSFFSTPAHVRTICIATRCPESLWIANLGYRGRENETSSNSTDEVKLIRRYDDTGYFHTGYGNPVFLDVQTSGKQRHNVTWDDSTNKETTVKRQKRDIVGYTRLVTPVYLEAKQYLKMNIIPENGYTKIKVVTNPEGYNIENEDGYVKKILFYNNEGAYTINFRLNEMSEEERDKEIARIMYGFPFIGAVILFFANLLFFIFAALLMWSWASELDWADYYIEDEPVVVYEEED